LGLKKIDYNNILFFYFLFSLSNNFAYNLRIHLFNLSKNELSNLEYIKQINENYPKLFKFINNETISHRINNKNTTNSEAFQNYFGNNNLVINNYDQQYMSNELKNIINNLNSYYLVSIVVKIKMKQIYQILFIIQIYIIHYLLCLHLLILI
jgi:hypothetical protein